MHRTWRQLRNASAGQFVKTCIIRRPAVSKQAESFRVPSRQSRSFQNGSGTSDGPFRHIPLHDPKVLTGRLGVATWARSRLAAIRQVRPQAARGAAIAVMAAITRPACTCPSCPPLIRQFLLVDSALSAEIKSPTSQFATSE